MLKDTYAPVLLEKKARRLAKETNNPKLRSILATDQTIQDKFKVAIIRPLRLLILVPLVTSAALYVAVVYGILYLLIATFSFVYKDEYGFDEGSVGLTFLPAGIGMMIGVSVFGVLGDVMVKKAQAQGGKVSPEIRIKPALVLPCAVVLPVGLFIYGWTAEYRVHWIVPMLGVVIFCIGLMGVMVSYNHRTLDDEILLTAK